MEPTFPINYRAGWIEPVDEYIPEIMEPKPEWQTPIRLPDYGPVVDDDPQPTHFITDPSKTYQKNAIHGTLPSKTSYHRVHQ